MDAEAANATLFSAKASEVLFRSIEYGSIDFAEAVGGGRQEKRINLAMQKHKTISDSEQERMNMAFERQNNAMLTPLVSLVGC
jgi:hypothetical protein